MSASVRVLWILLLALLAGPALALGLGQIKVKSQHGQPLLAEIPILSSDPSELEHLQARLASPETFARIGLDPPQGLVSDLQFTVALDARGQPIVRITSQAPVQQSLLTFLVEVDWGQGRLVREYSALVDAPQSVSAVAQPQVQAPQLAMPDTIVREPALEAAPVTALSAEAAAAAPPPPVAVAPAAAPPPRAPAPVPVRVDAPPPAPPVVAAPAQAPREVRSGQTLSQLAGELAFDDGHSLNQTMLALLRANPEAFIGGNINRVREGAVLRVPTATDYVHSAAEANVLVRQQVSQWRESRRPPTQPETVPEAAPAAASATPARSGDARLAIVPAVGDERSAGTRSGLSAGGEGDMLRRQELVQTKETLAAREAELVELRARVSELEQLQQQQAQLITLKDSELAAAQQRLATSHQQAASAEPVSPAAEAAQGGTTLPWTWLGAGLIALALLVLWRRRIAPTRTRTPTFDAATLAAARPADDVAGLDEVRERFRATDREDAAQAQVVEETVPSPAAPGGRAPATLARHERGPGPVFAHDVEPAPAMPTWHVGSASGPAMTLVPDMAGTDAAGQESVEHESVEHESTEHESTEHESAVRDAFAADEPAGRERIELARAYLDLGDVDTARSLLREVADTGDDPSRSEAARLLRDLA